MKRYKGCVNPDCKSCKARTKIGADRIACRDCGEVLVYVCKDCFTVLPENHHSAYCFGCEAKHKDKRDSVWNGVKKVGGVALSAAGIVLTYFGKDIIPDDLFKK